MQALLYALALIFSICGCNLARSTSNGPRDKVSITPSPIATPQKLADPSGQEASVLCDRIGEIRKLPYRNPADSDPIYEALMAKGREAVPCLIEKIAETTPMPDPREAPTWRNYVVGDTAAFILVRLADSEKDLIPLMLSPKSRKEWETQGVYAYFNYVAEPANRRRLQEWWRKWLKDNPPRKPGV